MDYDAYICPLLGTELNENLEPVGRLCAKERCPAWWTLTRHNHQTGEETSEPMCAFHALPAVLGELSFKVSTAQAASEQARNEAATAVEQVDRLGLAVNEAAALSRMDRIVGEALRSGHEIKLIEPKPPESAS